MLEPKGNQEARHKGLAGAGAQKAKLMATQDLVFKVLIVISTSKWSCLKCKLITFQGMPHSAVVGQNSKYQDQ